MIMATLHLLSDVFQEISGLHYLMWKHVSNTCDKIYEIDATGYVFNTKSILVTK